MLRFMLCCLVIFTILSIAFSSMTEVTTGASLETQQSQLTELLSFPAFSLSTILNPGAWVSWLDTAKDVVSFNYPGILTGTIGNLVRFAILLPLELISLLTLVCLINGLVRGNTIVSW